jgi:hypothetical protein
MSEETALDLITRLLLFRRRMRLRDGWHRFQRLSCLAAMGVFALLLVGRVVPIPRLWMWAFLGPWLLSLGASFGYALLRPITLLRAARQIDLELGLKERISTALEFSNAHEQLSPGLLLQRQYTDALAVAGAADPRRDFPFTWLRRPTLAAVSILVASLVLAWLPNPMDAVLAEREAVKQATQVQAEKVEALQQEIEQDTSLTPELQAELLRQLEALAQQLRQNSGDREEALADLSRLEMQLRRQIDPQAIQRQASLEAISTELQTLAGLDQVDQDDLDLTIEALEKLTQELAEMTDSERLELASALAQLAAQAAQSGSSDLSQSLASLSQAAQSGSAESAAQASSQAGEALAQARQQNRDQNALQQALAQLQNASRSMAQAGQSGRQLAGQQPGGQPGNNPGQGMSGGGTRADTLPPATGSGQTRRPDSQDSGPSTADPADQLFVPWERRSEEGQEVTIPGQDTGQGEIITRQNPNPSGGLPGPALIPYQQVFARYQQAAQQTMDRSEIPPAYRQLVRDYFTLLEP